MKGKFFLKKDKQKKGKSKKKIIIIAVSLVTILVVIGGVAFFALRKNGNVENPFAQMMGGGRGNSAMSGMSFGEDMVTASGVINMGMSSESFDVENLSTRLEIEEVYVSSGETIEAGTKVMKISEDSVTGAREELQSVLEAAELAYRAGVIEYEQNKITAKYNYDSTVLAGEQAEEIYQETIAGLDSSVEKAKEELADTKAKIAEYESYVNDSSYKSYFKVDEYQVIYDENLQLLTDKIDEWGVSWSEVTSGRAPSNPGSDLHSQYVYVLSNLYSVLEDNLSNLEQAQSDYEDAVSNASLELQTLKLQLPSLEQAISEAENSYDLQVAQAKLTYESCLDAAERAQEDYETALEQAEDEYEALKETYEDAKTNLELFESSVGDGCYYARESGTIMRVGVRANQRMSSGSTILMFSDGEEMTVTVSVDQSDIAALSVGDEAYVMSSIGSGCSGTITTINPVTASDSRTNITYSVTVVLTDSAESGLTSNESVTVIFGISAEDMENMMSNLQGGMSNHQAGQMWGNQGDTSGEFGVQGGTPGEMPERGQMPEGMEIPEGMEMPEGGQMPGGFGGGDRMPGDSRNRGNGGAGGEETKK